MAELAKEYAAALFSLACESKEHENYAAHLKIVDELFMDNPSYLEFLSSPAISKTERTQAIHQAFHKSLPKMLVSFLKLLCEKNRIRELNSIISEYQKLVDLKKQISYAKVRSPFPLSDAEKAKLTEKLEKQSGRSVVLHCSLDASLIGGIVVEIDSKVIDGSLNRHLSDIKDVISK